MSEQEIREEIKALTKDDLAQMYDEIENITQAHYVEMVEDESKRLNVFNKIIYLTQTQESTDEFYKNDTFRDFLGKEVAKVLNSCFGCDIQPPIHTLDWLASRKGLSYYERMAIILSQYYYGDNRDKIDDFLVRLRNTDITNELNKNLIKYKYAEVCFKNLLYQLEDEN